MREGEDQFVRDDFTRALGSFRGVLRIDKDYITAREWVATVVKHRTDEARERKKMEQEFSLREEEFNLRADKARHRKRLEEEQKAAEKRRTSCCMRSKTLCWSAAAVAAVAVFRSALDWLRARHSDWMNANFAKLETSMSDNAVNFLETLQEAMAALQWQTTLFVLVGLALVASMLLLARWRWVAEVTADPVPEAEGSAADDVNRLRTALGILDNRLEMANHEVDTLNDSLDTQHAELVEAYARVSDLTEELLTLNA
jgi:hypothetical protein